MEKVWVIEDPDERPKKRTVEQGPPPDKKSPAAAYSLSILLWGSGQFYADRIGKGLMFFFLMLLVAAGTVLGVLHRDGILSLLRSRGIAVADAFLVEEFFLLCTLVFWTYNASDAYHAVARERRRPFTGVKSRIFPVLCSLLFPGWGQYLNGQPLKGSVFASFSVIGCFALLSAALTLVAWPGLEASGSRDIIEGIFAAALFAVPVLPFLWIFGCYDALKVSLDDYLKEPFLERIKAANNRRRTQGWIRGVFPSIGNIAALVIVLAVFVAVVYRAFPEGYYVGLMISVREHLRREGMTIVPEIINTILAHLPPNK